LRAQILTAAVTATGLRCSETLREEAAGGQVV
jgi:hypothetical protein